MCYGWQGIEFDHGILGVSNLSKPRCRARATTTMAAVAMVEVTTATIAAIAMVVPTVAVEAGVRPAAITVSMAQGIARFRPDTSTGA